jgi:hypothetical protein
MCNNAALALSFPEQEIVYTAAPTRPCGVIFSLTQMLQHHIGASLTNSMHGNALM